MNCFRFIYHPPKSSLAENTHHPSFKMKTGYASFVLATGMAAALNMENYSPEKGVQPEFKPFYEACVVKMRSRWT